MRHPISDPARASRLLVAAAPFVLASGATAQLTWTSLGAVGPPARYGAATASDPLAGRAFVFGGIGTNGTLGDLWQLDAAGWTQVPSPSIPPRSHAATAARDFTVLLFGGRDANGAALSDGWLWTTSGWTGVTTLPAARESAALVRRLFHEDFVLFGGRDGALTYGDTWLFRAVPAPAWTFVPVTTSPSARFGHAMAVVDAYTMLLFGGVDAAGNVLDDTWLLDQLATPPVWTQLNPTVRPSARFGHAMRFAGHRGRVQLFGGEGPAGAFADTWEWDGASWIAIATAGTPTPRSHATLIDGAHPAQLAPWEGLLIGGRDGSGPMADVWQLTSTVPATLTDYGVPATVPLYLGAQWAWVGGAIRARCLQVPPGGPLLPHLVVGFSNTTSALGPLPIALGPELNNSSLHVDPVALLATDPAGWLTIPIPPAPTLVGAHVYMQGLGYGMLGPLFSGWALSRGLDVQLGWR